MKHYIELLHKPHYQMTALDNLYLGIPYYLFVFAVFGVWAYLYYRERKRDT